MLAFLKNNPFFTAFLVLLLVFIAAKVPFLNLPYYWDEAWVYAPAIQTMHSTGLNILPNSIPPELSRGHPLLFHFLGASWLTVFGTSLVSAHAFALFVSLLLLVAVYFFGKKIFQNVKTGFTAAFILALQPVFIAQSGLLLPEVMLSLFSLLALYFYLDNKKTLYVIAGILTVMVKETGTLVVATLLLWTLLETLFSDDGKKWKKFFINSLVVSLPLIPFTAFFIYQHQLNGWFFFPEHIGLISGSSDEIWDKLNRYLGYVFIYQGRNLLTFSIIIAFFVILFSGRTLEENERRSILILLLYLTLFLVFSSMNFYSDRYTMPLIPVLALLFAFAINKAFDYKWIPWSVLIVAAGLQWQHINKRTNSDHNLGYANAIETHSKAIDFCVEKNLQNKKIYASFLMIHYLGNPYCGYVSKETKFNNLSGKFSDDMEYAVFSNVEDKANYDYLKTAKRLKLLQRFESRQAWTEVYKVE